MALRVAIRKPPWITPRYAVGVPHLALRCLSQLPSFPVVATCPSPTCACAATPEGLDIDHGKPLSGTMAAYAEQVVISTGRDDWASRIEAEEGRNLAKELRGLLGPKGRFHDVRRGSPS